jgi:hypothetical protein
LKEYPYRNLIEADLFEENGVALTPCEEICLGTVDDGQTRKTLAKRSLNWGT